MKDDISGYIYDATILKMVRLVKSYGDFKLSEISREIRIFSNFNLKIDKKTAYSGEKMCAISSQCGLSKTAASKYLSWFYSENSDVKVWSTNLWKNR